jgi:hypothetical protein
MESATREETEGPRTFVVVAPTEFVAVYYMHTQLIVPLSDVLQGNQWILANGNLMFFLVNPITESPGFCPAWNDFEV